MEEGGGGRTWSGKGQGRKENWKNGDWCTGIKRSGKGGYVKGMIYVNSK